MSDLFITNQRKPQAYISNPSSNFAASGTGPNPDNSFNSAVSTANIISDTALTSAQEYFNYKANTPVDGFAANMNKIDFLVKYRPYANLAAKATPLINVGFGVYDAKQAYQKDVANADYYHTELTKSTFGTLTSVALGAAAGVTIAATGVALLPAIGLALGAGLAGNAIGQELGKGFVWARKNWW